MLAMTLTMPLASLIVDRLGRKRTYMLGICIYGVFSVIGAVFHASIEIFALLVRFMHGADRWSDDPVISCGRCLMSTARRLEDALRERGVSC